MALQIPLVVEYGDGSTQEVNADQRDQAALERAEGMSFPDCWKGRYNVTLRVLAWEALRRQKLLAQVGTRPERRDEWEDRAVQVLFGHLATGVDDEEEKDEGEEEAPLDRGPKAASGAGTSSSPSNRASRSKRSASTGTTAT